MSAVKSGEDDPSLDAALADLLRAGLSGTVTAAETVSGRVVLQEDHVAGGGEGFGECRFELSIRSERLGLETKARIYEEVSLLRTRSTYVQTVAATLRREQAEIDFNSDQKGNGSLAVS